MGSGLQGARSRYERYSIKGRWVALGGWRGGLRVSEKRGRAGGVPSNHTGLCAAPESPNLAVNIPKAGAALFA